MKSIRTENTTLRLVVGSLLYQGVWFATVLSSSSAARWWWGVLAVIGFAGFAAYGWPNLRQRVWVMASAAVACGLVVDTAMLAGRVWYAPSMLMPAPLPPLWLVMLWAAFGMYIAISLEMLYGRYGVATIVGAFGGMLAYRGGAWLGAIEWGKPAWLSTAILMLAWAAVFPVLVWVATKWRAQEQTVTARVSRTRVAFM